MKKISLFMLGCVACALSANAALLISHAKPATANAYLHLGSPGLVTDGRYDTWWSAGGYATANDPNWVTVDLLQAYPISSVTVVGADTGESYWKDFTVEFVLRGSLDNSAWVGLGSGILYDNPIWESRAESFDVGGTEYRYIQVYSTAGQHWTSIAQIEVFAVPEPSTYLAGALMLMPFAAAGVRAFRRTRIV
ncbi:MAG: discoidin domain-containing protein [Verrucomicrobia bacterium]|nr:discoidin domain-containing protein [Verrucomicrobiota bacterium]